MQIDTIKKRDQDSKGIIDLKNKNTKKTFKLTYLKVILKDKKEIVFYFSLFFIMGVIIFFWVLSFKNYSEEFNKKSQADKAKYQEIISAYDVIKKDIGESLDSMKEQIQASKEDNTKKTSNDLQENLLLDSLTDEQKQQLISKPLDNTTNNTIETLPQEFSQEELKVRLDLLNKNQ